MHSRSLLAPEAASAERHVSCISFRFQKHTTDTSPRLASITHSARMLPSKTTDAKATHATGSPQIEAGVGESSSLTKEGSESSSLTKQGSESSSLTKQGSESSRRFD